MNHWHGIAFLAGALTWHWFGVRWLDTLLSSDKLIRAIVGRLPTGSLRQVSVETAKELRARE